MEEGVGVEVGTDPCPRVVVELWANTRIGMVNMTCGVGAGCAGWGVIEFECMYLRKAIADSQMTPSAKRAWHGRNSANMAP